MYEDIYVSLIWGVPGSRLPAGVSPYDLKLENYRAGVQGEGGDQGGGVSEEFFGLQVTENLTGLNEITHAEVSFESLEEMRREVEGKLKAGGIEIPVELYVIQELES